MSFVSYPYNSNALAPEKIYSPNVSKMNQILKNKFYRDTNGSLQYWFQLTEKKFSWTAFSSDWWHFFRVTGKKLLGKNHQKSRTIQSPVSCAFLHFYDFFKKSKNIILVTSEYIWKKYVLSHFRTSHCRHPTLRFLYKVMIFYIRHQRRFMRFFFSRSYRATFASYWW